MARDKSRSLQWGSARRPRTSNKLGNPIPREGSDGDIQIRQTGIGARLFAKIGGRWFSNKLYGNELDSPDVFMPKMWNIIGYTAQEFDDATCDTTNTDATVTMDDTSSLVQYQTVTGAGIPANNYVKEVTDATHFELIAAATATASDVTLTFGGAQNISLPEFLTWANVCSIGFMVNLGSDNLHAWTWNTPTAAGALPIHDDNRIEVSLDKNLRAIKLLHMGESDATTGKEFRLSVFFK